MDPFKLVLSAFETTSDPEFKEQLILEFKHYEESGYYLELNSDSYKTFQKDIICVNPHRHSMEQSQHGSVNNDGASLFSSCHNSNEQDSESENESKDEEIQYS